MSHEIIHTPAAPLLLPELPVTTRAATEADLPWIDAMQKTAGRALGFFRTKQLAEYVRGGWVVIAEESVVSGQSSVAADERSSATDNGRLTTDARMGYILYKDRYLKRDELGVVYQLCVAERARRRLVGAQLVRAAIERSAYGCRLFCCWCAQDLAANRFWEGLGFVPIAFRAGSTGKRRVHIFWQRRIDRPDDGGCDDGGKRHGRPAAPYWYPFQTNAGAIREDRIVFPIPPGVDWREVKGEALRNADCGMRTEAKAPPLPSPNPAARAPSNPPSELRNPQPDKIAVFVGGRVRYIPKPGPAAPPPAPTAEKQRRPASAERKPAAKIDPAYLRAARDLRDRWLERVNTMELQANGKHDVSRAIEATPTRPTRELAA